MAGRNRAVLSCGSGDPLSPGDAGDGYTYLPWVDLICAGVPCQDVSVAGKRAGLAGQRTGLFYDFARLLRELRPTWFLFENVPGLLSSNRGRDFAEVLRVLMVECGYGVQWRVLDSQFFGVAQRRRRLFVVGYFGKPCPPEVLFEPTGGAGNFAESVEAWQDIAAPLTRGSGVTGNAPGRRREDDFNLAVAISASAGHHGHSRPRGDGSDGLILGRDANDGHSGLLHAGERSDDARETAFCLRSDPGGTGQGHNTTYAIQDVRGQRDKKQNGIGLTEDGPMYTIDKTSQHGVAYHASLSGLGNGGSDDNDGQDNRIIECSAPYSSGVRDAPGISEEMDDSLPAGMDSARYRALGNAVTVKVIRWIAERIVAYEKLKSGLLCR